jgi:hypothetical protein
MPIPAPTPRTVLRPHRTAIMVARSAAAATKTGCFTPSTLMSTYRRTICSGMARAPLENT